MTPLPRLKVLRVVTVHECVLWHLGKTLDELAKHFDVTVAGEGVSRYADRFPDIAWVDIDIPRKAQPLKDLKSLFQLFRLCRRLRPDVVHSIMPKAGLLTALAARAAGITVRMHTFTGQVWDTKTGFSRRVYKLLDRVVVRLNSVCLTDSPSQSLHLHANGVSLRGQPLPVLGKGSLVGVDLERFDPERIRSSAQVTRSSLALSDANFVITFIARKSRDKGALDMLKSFSVAKKSAPDMRLLFIGPDESAGEIDRLRQTESSLFDAVLERGTVANHEEYLLISDLLCMPSYREGFGSVVIDAAALGVPCVGSRIAGLVDSIDDGKTGLLHPPGDIAKLAELLLQLHRDRDRLAALGQEARTRTRTYFSSEVMGRLLVDFYRAQVKTP
jgi:glycosyltransferase involved in cell wall biosynthesis